MDSPGGSLDESLTTGMAPAQAPSDPNALFFHESLNSWSSLTFLAVMSAVWALKSLLWFDGGEDLEAHLEYFQNWVCVGIPSLLVFLSASSVGAFFDACWSVYDVEGAWWGFYQSAGGAGGGPLMGETTRSRGASSRGTVDHLSGMNAIANLNSTLLSDATQNRLREHLRAQQDVLFRERHKNQFSTNNAKSVRGLVFLAALFFLTEKGKSAVQRIARTLRTSWRGLAEDSSPASEGGGGELSAAGRQDVGNGGGTGATTTSFGEADDLTQTHSTSARSASANPGEMRAPGQINHGDHDATPVSWKSRKIKAAFHSLHSSTTSTPTTAATTVENLGQSLKLLVHYLRRGHETVINGDLYGIFRRLAIVIVILRQPSAWINIALPSQLLDSLYQLLFPSSSAPLIAEQWGNKLKWWQEKLDWCLFSMHFVKIVQFWLFLLRHNGEGQGGSDWLSGLLGFVWVWQLWLSFYDDTFSKGRSN
mmetsp:Transcript_4929/g.12304  ORF Transcript_4929/g.12304 Transcript_4929/m.12304 type:complete len:479 (+) Transcript_4929:202-1638(+)